MWEDDDVHTFLRHNRFRTLDDIPCLFDLHVKRECHIHVPWTDTGVELAETILFQGEPAIAELSETLP